jgi:acyl-CoA thioester hydrolase
MPMIEVLRSAVNTWECDQMGHLNVRHYVARAGQGLAMLGLQLGLGPAHLRQTGLVLRARDHHVRFHRELRPGAPYTLSAGVLSANQDVLHVYEEMRAVATGEVAATIVSEVLLVDAVSGQAQPFSAECVKRARDLHTELPEHGAPRGIARETPRELPLREEAITLGMTAAFLGPILPEDCDAYGYALEATFMGRISDGIGHFFRALRQGLRPDGVGGAALEYRYVYYARPRMGDVIEVRTGLKALGRKTLHFCHFVFDVETGRCLATSEAVAVSFDLAARKAVDISAEARAVMETRILAGLSV